jgi:hypothetical protein
MAVEVFSLICFVHQKLTKWFSSCGTVESIRFRSIALKLPAIDRRDGCKGQLFHEKRDTMNAYVVMSREEDVSAALLKNGELFADKHLRVDRASGTSSGKVQ